MNLYPYKEFVVEVFDDPEYSPGQAGGKQGYAREYFADNSGKCLPISKHGISVRKEDKIIANCIVMAYGSPTDIRKHSSLLHNDCLLVCCCHMIFCLSLPHLDLLWQTSADTGTCFKIFPLEEGYIVHGELEISKLDKEGRIEWQFSGADIFVTADWKDPFILTRSSILITDWTQRQHKIGFDGKVE